MTRLGCGITEGAGGRLSTLPKAHHWCQGSTEIPHSHRQWCLKQPLPVALQQRDALSQSSRLLSCEPLGTNSSFPRNPDRNGRLQLSVQAGTSQ